ncbi:MAG: hemolysin XhlA family protein [Lachnospiraceae bacterium]|nr:hemolysin XhlA family protein [Lachnospiraceae bacterium]
MPDNSFEREVLDRLIKIEAKLESWDSSKKQIYDNQRDIIHLKEQTDQQQRDIDELRDRNKWLGRTTAGAAISAVVSAIIAAALVVLHVAG